MKRGNDNSQLRAEEVESLNDAESEERGSFKRASAEVLANRKIFKAKRPNNNEASSKLSLPTPTVLPDATKTVAQPDADSSSNPFAKLSGFVTNPPTVAVTSNPFAGFSGLATSSSASIRSNKDNIMSKYVSKSEPKAAASVRPDEAPFTDCTKEVSGDEYRKKMGKLNASFFKWASRQINDHPLSMWRDGLQEYIRYSDELAAKYNKPINQAPTTTSGATFTSTAAASLVPTSTVVTAVKNNTKTEDAPKAPSSTPAEKSALFESGKLVMPSLPVPTSTASFTDMFAFKKPLSLPSAPVATNTIAPISFQFGNSTTTAASAPAFTSTFTWPAAGTTSVPAFPKFGGFTPSTTSTAAFPAVGGFNLPKLESFVPPPAVATKGDNDENGGNDDEGEGEPVLEPEKVLRNENDTDEILLDVPCKLYGFSNDSKEWKDTGKGTFRVTRSADTKKQRMLVRNPIGKLTFNAAFYKGMKIERVKGGLRFSAFVVGDDNTAKPELKGFMVKLKLDDIENALSKLEAGVRSCE